VAEINEKSILTAGLLAGYASKNKPLEVSRAGFLLKSSDYSGSEGKYHDEWAADFTGAGQEIGETPDGRKYTRVYGGGTVGLKELEKLGLTKKEVGGKLVSFIQKLGDETRLDKNAEAVDGLWTYRYKVLKTLPSIPVEMGEEEIKYDGQLVFVHFHIFCPVT